MSQVFRSTRVLTAEGLAPAALVVEDEQIAEIGSWDRQTSGVPLTDFGDAVLMPGLVDSHVHINEPGRTEWEGFWTATRAAASGGITTLVDMPLNSIPETISVEALQAKRSAAQGKTWVDWAAWGGVVRGNANALPDLAASGIPGFKCFLIHSGIDGFAWVDEADLRVALEQLKGTGLPLLAHAEVRGPVDAATRDLNAACADRRKYSTYLASRPDQAELEAITLLIRLAEEFQSPIHIVHLSSAEALPLLAAARDRGVLISAETCVQYLWFAAEDIPDGATEFKCAPPIRRRTNRDALWAALEEGRIAMVTTDHSPCPPAMKHLEQGYWDEAWGGIASLGLALPLMATMLERRGVELKTALKRLSGWMSMETARLAGLAGRKGALLPGADADFLIFDPETRWTVAPQHLHFRHKLSPYLGVELRGSVLQTWLRGKQVFAHQQFINQPRGQELVRP